MISWRPAWDPESLPPRRAELEGQDLRGTARLSVSRDPRLWWPRLQQQAGMQRRAGIQLQAGQEEASHAMGWQVKAAQQAGLREEAGPQPAGQHAD